MAVTPSRQFGTGKSWALSSKEHQEAVIGGWSGEERVLEIEEKKYLEGWLDRTGGKQNTAVKGHRDENAAENFRVERSCIFQL